MSIARALPAFAAVLWLGACGTQADNPMRGALSSALQQVLSPQSPETLDADILRARLTPELRAQIARPVLIAEVPVTNVAAVIVEAEKTGKHTTWFSADSVSVTTYNGLIVATRGLGFDLMGADIQEAAARITEGKTGTAPRKHSYLDGEDRIYWIAFTCQYQHSAQPNGSLVAETCTSDGRVIENQYWLDARAKVVASKQWIGPRNGYILLEGPIYP